MKLFNHFSEATQQLPLPYLLRSPHGFFGAVWIVICPWVETGSWARSYEATYRPPVSPAWSPPRPIEGSHEFSSWEGALGSWWASGAGGPTGEARIRPDWMVIGLKFGLSLLLIYFVTVGRALLKTTRRVTRFTIDLMAKYAKDLITESKRQNKPSHHNPLPAPSSFSRGDYNPQSVSKPRSR